eukprot:scaffold426306_cov41-Prasinocladus_malaysianus.AAC.1
MSPDFWNKYESDIQLVKNLGSNCFRFSFEWGRLEPERDMWDESAFQRYSEIIDCLEVRTTQCIFATYDHVIPETARHLWR